MRYIYLIFKQIKIFYVKEKFAVLTYFIIIITIVSIIFTDSFNIKIRYICFQIIGVLGFWGFGVLGQNSILSGKVEAVPIKTI